MIELKYDKTKTILLAEKDDLTSKQFIALADVLNAQYNDIAISLDKALFALYSKSLLRFLLTPPDIRQRCYEHIGWVFEKLSITKQLIPQYRHRFTTLYGPASDFDNLRLSEFHHSEHAYHKIIHSETMEDELEALNELVAVLYREPKPNYDVQRNSDGDCRKPFKPADTDYYIKKVARWPLVVKQAILIWYDSCREDLRDSYPEAFKSSGTETTGDYYEGLFGLIRSLSGNKYGTFQDTENLFVHNAFMEIVASIEEEEKLKRMYGKQQ
ncbi:hypothetical protein [Limnovirga soli]|uniref:Uncharacterized protein n=1 Tax=Limnovirga soli TaxID=2656915 RepID=A0A8J8JVG3_9BACT|nr:hypothetical protein [Limnovirga soli]NNV57365.1 hypothetical protein [Limnovirga soli]